MEWFHQLENNYVKTAYRHLPQIRCIQIICISHFQKGGAKLSTRQDQSEKREPLLYIIQPKTIEVTGNMQMIYIANLSEKENNQIKDESSEQSLNKNSDIAVNEELVHEKNEYHFNESLETNTPPLEKQIEIEEIEAKTSINTGFRRKSFKDMDIQSKIDYLVSMPNYLPKVISEIKTKNFNYTGVILKFENGMVFFDQLNMEQRPIQIDIKEIIDLKIASN